MEQKKVRMFYCVSLVIVIAASFYPLSMGVRVLADMLSDGTVLAQNYPKYLIPYTPVSVAVILGSAILPLSRRFFKKAAFTASALISTAVFFAVEFLLEKLVIVTETIETTLESWQMYMCYVSPSSYTTKIYSAEQMIIGDYSPAFKLHFYIIAILLILSILNCIYTCDDMIRKGNKDKKKSTVLALQTASTVLFLCLCILACFTAFWRTGEILVSPLSAFLMILFFIVFGLTAGIFHGSFSVGRKKLFSCVLPSLVSAVMTAVMYVGELILLGGKLYRLGNGAFFEPMGNIPFSLCDIAVIAASFCLCYLTLALTSKINRKGENK